MDATVLRSSEVCRGSGEIVGDDSKLARGNGWERCNGLPQSLAGHERNLDRVIALTDSCDVGEHQQERAEIAKSGNRPIRPPGALPRVQQGSTLCRNTCRVSAASPRLHQASAAAACRDSP